jgi:4-amino-4-deoxy-L-arabinose transferase-like glycosyltransferase
VKAAADDRIEKLELSRRRLALLAGAAMGLAVFALYLATLAPTILYYTYQMKDSAVLPAVAHTLGISHPTGYPTYTILTHLFTYMPFGDVAYRVNLASAVFGALAVVLLFGVGYRLSRSIAASALGAIAFGVSGLFWSQAVIAEVYTLHVLFLAIVLFVLLLWRNDRRDRYLLLAAFLIGLSMTHHLTSGLLLPAAALFVLLDELRKVLEWKVVLGGAGLFLVGLVPYAYLPLRARMDPVMNVEDPSNWERFRDMLTGGEFRDQMWAFGPGELPGRFVVYLDHLFGQFHWAIVMAAIGGLVYLLFRDRAAFALLGFLFAGFLFYALEYDISDVYHYFIPTYALLALCASVGLGALLGKAEILTGRFGFGARVTTAAVLTSAAFAAALWGVGDTYREVDMSEDYEGRRILSVVARETAPNAIVIHHRSPLQYMRLVEGRREDITPWGFAQPLNQQETDEAMAAIREDRFYILFPNKAKARLFTEAGYRVVAVEEGTLYQVVP